MVMKPTQKPTHIMTPTYIIAGMETALRMIEEYREQLIKAQHDPLPNRAPNSLIVLSYQELYDVLNDLESAICGELEYDDEED